MTGIAPLAEAAVRQSAGEVVAGLGLRTRPAPPGRPRVVAAMIGSADGRAAVAGRSVGLGHPQDRALLRALRATADAVLVGAATVRAEGYANLLDPEHVDARVRAGLAPRPVVAILTRSGMVPWEVGLFAEPDVSVVVCSGAEVSVPAGIAADVQVAPVAEPAAALAALRERCGAAVVLCEGGPRVLHAVASDGLLDDLVLTIAPLLVGGDAPGLLAGPELEPPRGLVLAGLWRADDHAFLHYTT
jgi:riboflavin biosynthesis pyrimidine reductase